MEPDDEFEERAFGAAGPVFLVALGVLTIGVLAVLAVFGMIGGTWGWIGFGVGVALSLAGVAWGALSGEESSVQDEA